jgi:hypothetical protein
MHWFATFLKDKNVHVTNLSTSDVCDAIIKSMKSTVIIVSAAFSLGDYEFI